MMTDKTIQAIQETARKDYKYIFALNKAKCSPKTIGEKLRRKHGEPWKKDEDARAGSLALASAATAAVVQLAKDKAAKYEKLSAVVPKQAETEDCGADCACHDDVAPETKPTNHLDPEAD